MPAADLVLSREVVFAWKESTDPTPGYPWIHLQVIVEFKNQGTGWAQIFQDHSSKVSFFDVNGVPTGDTTGALTYAFPEYVGPGDLGYLFGSGAGYGKAEDLVSVEYALGPGSLPGVQMPGTVSCHCFQSVAPPGVTFEVSGISWLSDGSHPGLLASGSVTVSGGNAIPLARVAVLCIGEDGSILGVTAAGNVLDVQPSEPRAFETAEYTSPLKPSDCATSIGLFGRDHSGRPNRAND